MVERTEARGFEEFTGTVADVHMEESSVNGEMQKQCHISITPHDVTVKGKTGLMHEWIRLPEGAAENTVPEGSVADKFLAQLELMDSKVKTLDVAEAFAWLKGRTFLWKKVRHGKSYQGYAAKEYWTPAKEVLSENSTR